jgi:hypothetical protein
LSARRHFVTRAEEGHVVARMKREGRGTNKAVNACIFQVVISQQRADYEHRRATPKLNLVSLFSRVPSVCWLTVAHCHNTKGL